jgi:CRISPR-associated endonuclease/helicase Cas3
MSIPVTTPAAPATAGRISLNEGDFPDFFREIHEWEPFPWQVKLLEQVLTAGWRDIDVPTGLGKTATLDVAVFAAALGCPAARRRMFLVVNRRIIVDQAHKHALKIQKALSEGAGPVCREVALRLAAPGEDTDAPVLDVTRMRGGVDWDWLWLERPDRYAIVTGTVDQIGSRLLFRGYGVSDHSRPIDAAMAGADSLILVDEAHLSDVFMISLRDLRQFDCPAERLFPRPVIVAMSASPRRGSEVTHGTTAADEQDPVAGPRLKAPRQLHLVTVSASGAKEAFPKMAGALAWHAQRLGGPGRVTGVVVNTVAMAREVFRHLHEAGDGQCMLLTGRIRPVDREYLLHGWLPKIRADNRQAPPDTPLYVIATQTIEAGADIDLDALVTEAPALPALIQRLGRLNRRGSRKKASAVVLHCEKLTPGVYGDARDVTWTWLSKLTEPVKHSAKPSFTLGAGADVSPRRLRELTGAIDADDLQRLYGKPQYAPVIFADTLAAWARTSPAPVPDVPPEPYLHGVDQGQPVVSLCWRGDMEADDTARWGRTTERARPRADEVIELPLAAVRSWLAGLPATELADTEAQVAPGAADDAGDGGGKAVKKDPESVHPPRQVLRYQASGDAQVISHRQIRPGDMLLVPASWGGCDRYGWAPDSVSPVHDVADLCGGTRWRGSSVRIGGQLTTALAVHAPDLAGPVGELMSQVSHDVVGESPDLAGYRAALAELADCVGPADRDLPHARVLRQLAARARLTVLDDDAGILLAARGASAATGDDDSAAGSSASPVLRPLGLQAHQDEVALRALLFATSLGLPATVARSCALAGLWHDEGKRDRRFQVMLHRGDHLAARAATELLAKSGMDPADRKAMRRAAQLTGWPSLPHEDLSGRIAAAYLRAGLARPALDNLRARSGADSGAGDVDCDLVLHLVASHHGRARPLLDPVEDRAPVTIEVPLGERAVARFSSSDLVDWEGPERFARLCQRYGYWGLAALEAIVRQADIWCSARPRAVPQAAKDSS